MKDAEPVTDLGEPCLVPLLLPLAGRALHLSILISLLLPR